MSDPVREIENPQNANEFYFDREVDHAVDVRRFVQGTTRESDDGWREEDLLLALWLRTVIGRLTPGSTERNRTFLEELRRRRSASFRQWSNRLRSGITSFAREEAAAERNIIQASIPIKTKVKPATRRRLRAELKRPIGGKTLTELIRETRDADFRRIAAAVRRGVVEGQSVDEIMAGIAGTRAKRFSDGVLAQTRRNTAAIVQTASTHAINAAKAAVWAANGPFVRALRWTAILDGRTSAICRSRDGKFTPTPAGFLLPKEPRLVPPGARPPAHINCRSWMIAVLNGEVIVGDRVVVTMQDGSRVDFRKLAKQNGTSVATERARFINREFGGPSRMLTYNDWLKRQPAARQDEILGKTKGKLFREGGLTMDSYVDRNGNELTLKQLAERRPSAFRKAGLDPEDF